MIDKGAKAIFEAEVIAHKEELLAELSRINIRRIDHFDIMNSMQEAKIVARVRVDEVLPHMENLRRELENLRKELVKVEVEFNELKHNEVQLDEFEAEARATVTQYDIEHQTPEVNFQKYANDMEGIIGISFEEADSEAAAEAYMAFICDEL